MVTPAGQTAELLSFGEGGRTVFSFLKRKREQPGFRRYQHGENYTLLAPASWTQNPHPQFLSISAPEDAASITGNAYAKSDGTLSDFAEHRFSSVHEHYAPVSEERRYTINGRDIVIREYEGTWPGEDRPTYYVVACIQAKGIFVSLAIVTTREEFTKDRALYQGIVDSVEPCR